MGYRSSGPRKGSGQKFQKTQHEKKTKAAQKKANVKYVEETPVPSSQEILEKTLSSLNRLGLQVFAVSPFSQYFDDWLVNLRQAIAEFESNPSITVDEAFTTERTRIFADVEREIAEKRIREASLEESAKALQTENHRVVELDEAYATATRELGGKRNKELEALTKTVHDQEQELDRVQQAKTSLIFGFTKKAKAKKEAEVTQKLTAAKTELKLAVQNFKVEQDKLHDDYEQKKQVAMESVQRLEKEIEGIETDGSQAARQTACVALANAVKALSQRMPVPEAPQ
jgi:hypothetical protein